MKKKVLLADKSDKTRGEAEKVLRQQGFDVISVADGEKSLEILKFGRPDVLIIGGDMIGSGNQPLYQYIQQNTRLKPIPLLLIAAEDNRSLPFPDEVVIPRNFDSKDFIDRVIVFAGQSTTKQQPHANEPLEAANQDDALLDAALGLDRIEVTDSELMDKTQITSSGKRKNRPVGLVGADGFEQESDEKNENRKIESLLIPEDQTDIRRPKTEKTKIVDQSSSAKLEILTDQYGINEPESQDSAFHGRTHDYDWFVNEMQKEARASSSKSTTSSAESKQSHLIIDEPSSMVDPLTPVKADPVHNRNRGEEVEKFIDEFKRELEEFQSDDSEAVGIGKTGSMKKENHLWKDTVENLSSHDIELFTRQFASELAEKIAIKIINKIDANKLLNLIKSEVVSRIQNLS